jgi:hypothetical protein
MTYHRKPTLTINKGDTLSVNTLNHKGIATISIGPKTILALGA